MTTYKQFATISSQLYFCASPIRLDSYNRCQFKCTYCFSRDRSDGTAFPGLRAANAQALRQRLTRVSSGEIQSAFDEFVAARVPLQFGGMQDPFSGIEARFGVSLDLMKVLRDFDYPTIISTKSTMVATEPYLATLRDMNVLVRFSAAGVKEKHRALLEIGCPGRKELLTATSRLTAAGVPVSMRIQPVIPEHEKEALELGRDATLAGAKHLSFEFLKIGTEDKENTIRRVSEATQTDVWGVFRSRGIARIGRDYTIAPAAKLEFLRRARDMCRTAGVRFGAGDTEFIPSSDGGGCCNGSGYFVRGATQFRANFVGVVGERRRGDLIRFEDLSRAWQPTLNVHQYLTTNSRGREEGPAYSSWQGLIAHRWNGESGPYSPAFFFGVGWTGKYDSKGYKIYRIDEVL